MEIEQSSDFIHCSVEILEKTASSIIQELVKRRKDPNLNQNENENILTTIMNLNALSFLVQTEIFNQSTNPASYSVMRGNYLELSKILRESLICSLLEDYSLMNS